MSYPIGLRGPTLELREFVRPTGGDYFFMPSISAFSLFVDDHRTLTSRTRRSRVPMPTPSFPDLQSLFIGLAGLFNSGDYRGMRPWLHQDIIWTMLHHSDSNVGADSVVAWLLQQKSSLNPQFNPTCRQTKFLPGDGGAQISGLADWHAKKDAPKEPIYYNFTFTKENDQWLLINAFGAVLP